MHSISCVRLDVFHPKHAAAASSIHTQQHIRQPPPPSSTRGEARDLWQQEHLGNKAGERGDDAKRSMAHAKSLTRRLRGDHAGRLSPPAGVAGPVLAAPRLPRPAELALDGELAGTGLLALGQRVGAAEHVVRHSSVSRRASRAASGSGWAGWGSCSSPHRGWRW